MFSWIRASNLACPNSQTHESRCLRAFNPSKLDSAGAPWSRIIVISELEMPFQQMFNKNESTNQNKCNFPIFPKTCWGCWGVLGIPLLENKKIIRCWFLFVCVLVSTIYQMSISCSQQYIDLISKIFKISLDGSSGFPVPVFPDIFKQMNFRNLESYKNHIFKKGARDFLDLFYVFWCLQR